MRAIPIALPDLPFTEYSRLVSEIVDAVRVNTAFCELTAYPALARESLGDAIRVLRNVVVFVQDCHDKLNNSADDAKVIKALGSLAAGTTFGGIGDRAAKLRQYERWLARQAKHSQSDRHPLADQVLAIIKALGQ